ncbi:MAG: hypothetical protein IJV15_16120 [Lachnospiraceae bacterium]|nr:hypothetical protein [Lachnospiraceae bacterium]MBQ9610948.1 hypothetical protein [Lachnospiraceae bacterium]
MKKLRIIIDMMKVMFAFFDYKESKVRFLLDYAAIMVLFGELAYLIQSGLLLIEKRKK